jgi:uncharacterized membrane-anchored protein
MCTIVMSIAMLIFGIIALVRGQFTLTRTKVVSGVPARVIGVILLLPLPMMLVGGMLIGVFYAMQGKQPRPEDIQGPAVLLEVGVVLGSMLIAVVIGLATAGPPQRRRLPFELEEEYDRRFHEDDYVGGDRPDPDGLRPPEDRIRE